MTSTTPNFYSDPLTSETLNVSSRSNEKNIKTNEYGDNEKDDVEDRNSESSYHGFLPFLRMVQKKLLNYKFDSHESKLSVLQHLRDHLLENIRK